jgi:hypothetical protein
MKSFSRALVTLQAAQSFAPVTLNGQVRQSILVPGFTGAVSLAGTFCSKMFARQALTLPGAVFSISSGQNFAYTNFFCCVKWVTAGATVRYRLWYPSGALLAKPDYAGEIIPASSGACIEFWSTPTSTETPVVPTFSILTDIIEDPATCCSTTGTVLANTVCSIGQPDSLDDKFLECL